ncbi:hypothetical protein B0H10DRAFT_1369675, partial [Mycena sp. CBHHK59/15]
DGIGPFTSLGLWAVGTLHSTATLSIQSAPAACVGLGSCTVSIFSSSATATRLGRPFFMIFRSPNPNLVYVKLKPTVPPRYIPDLR